MEKNQLKNASFLDIVFDGRNKAYGAYLLRFNYEHRLRIALAVMVLVALVFCTINLLLSRKSSAEMPVLRITPVRIEPYKAPEKQEKKLPVYKQEQAAAPKQAMKKLTTPRITANAEVDPLEMPPKQTDRIRVGPVTQTGLAMDGQLAVPKEMKGVGTGNGAVPGGHKAADYEGTFKSVQVEASFPGGPEAWKNYLERNLRRNIPVDRGAAPGKYMVIVSFIVSSDGQTSEIKIEQAPNPDYGVGDEAIRVIQRSGRWNPAIQNGRAVTYREKQKIIFVVE